MSTFDVATSTKPGAVTVQEEYQHLDVPMHCTVLDQPFIARFRRKPGRTNFLFETSITALTRATVGTHAPASAGPAIRSDHLDCGDAKCPFCTADFYVRCGSCERFVCEGRTIERQDGSFFRCSQTCGSAGILRNVGANSHEVPGRYVSSTSEQQRLGIASPGTMRLTNVKALPFKG